MKLRTHSEQQRCASALACTSGTDVPFLGRIQSSVSASAITNRAKRCAACRAIAYCADCGPTSPLHDLGAALRGEPHDATLGEWPREDESGRVPCWLCWTGDNPMPAYLELRVEPRADSSAPTAGERRAAAREAGVQPVLVERGRLTEHRRRGLERGERGGEVAPRDRVAVDVEPAV